MVAVVLLNMGGPDSLDAVRPFLYNLFSDREIIRLGPSWLQKPLARWISMTRAPKSRECYRRIGGRSPITELSMAQAEALANMARDNGESGWIVDVGMRYWHPRTPEVVERLAGKGIERFLGVSLYPHFSRATSGSSIAEFRQACMSLGLEHEVVESYPDHAGYVAALVDTLGEAFDEAGFSRWTLPDDGALIYSAHSLPKRFVEEGDPYVEHVKATIRTIEELTGVKGHLCFQSRSGPVEWLEPATDVMLNELLGQGKRRIVVMPISFVSDHVETLYEIDLLYQEQAVSKGGRLFRTPALNTSPKFIGALYELCCVALERMGWRG